MSEPPSLFEADDVTRIHSRGGRVVRAVDHLSLRVPEGARLGIVGESGSGKSSLMRLLCGLDQPTSGTVSFRGRSLARRERDLADVRTGVQLVFQDPRSSLDPRMRVGQIITEPLRSPLARRSGRVTQSHAQRLTEVMEQVGLDPALADRYPHELSGGQRQRVAIARALAPRVDALIADEPVSALDVSSRAQVLNLLMDLVAHEGLALLFVSHDLAVVRHLCRDVVVMREGRIVEQGSVEDVYSHPQDPYTRELLDAVPHVRVRRMAPCESAATGEHPSDRRGESQGQGL